MKTLSLWFAVSAMALSTPAKGQDTPSPARGAHLTGKVTPPAALLGVDLTGFPASLAEVVSFEPPPLPEDWSRRTAAQQDQWIAAFETSDEGKAYFAEREKRMQNRRRFELDIAADGTFELLDVPPGRYALVGRREAEHDGRKYLIEVAAFIEVGPVDEMQMPPLELDGTRLLQPGEAAPPFELEPLGGGQSVSLAALAGQPLLVQFWSADSPSAAGDLQSMRATRDALAASTGLRLLTVVPASHREAAAQLAPATEADWLFAVHSDGTDSVRKAYGVQAAPTYALISAEGKIVLPPAVALAATLEGKDLTQMIREALATR